MENIIIAVGGAAAGVSPIMPYIGERMDAKYFTTLAKLYLGAALLRCGFDVIDCSEQTAEPQDMIMKANRNTVDAAVLISYAAFGSRKSFNDIGGSVIRYSQGRFGEKSRVMCEDICAKIASHRRAEVASDGHLGAANCPTAVIEGGYLTYFDEAKLVCDPDFAVEIAEHTAIGLCEHFGMPYVRRDDITAYPLLCSAATGKRGKKIKMLQMLLCANGYDQHIDGIFGKDTDRNIKAFCANNGLSENDGVCAAVWRDLLLLNPPHLTVGSKHNAVLYVQRKLFSKLYKTPRDGVLGTQTTTALNEFLFDVRGEACDVSADGLGAEEIKLLSEIGGGRPRLF